ncbi:MAG: ABC transporter permease, partial [Rhodospirillales bacterium]
MSGINWVRLESLWATARRGLALLFAIALGGLAIGLAFGLSQLNYPVIVENLDRLASGVGLTLQLLALALVVGAALALPIGIARAGGNRLAAGYIFIFRGTPLLVQIFLIYYGIGQFAFIRDSFLWPVLREPFWCAIIAFALNTAAYQAEILRGAIQAVPRGEVEAARAIGMSRRLALRRIILPSALRIGFPAYSNEVILMLKGTALASTVTLLDLTGMARTVIARTYMPVEIFLVAGLIYLLLTLVFTQVFR